MIAIILFLLAIYWMMTIFKLSSMNGQNSGDKSEGIIALFIEDTLDVTNEYGITSAHPSDEKLTRVSKLINAPMRKVMHASVYMVLAFLIILFINIILNNKHYWIALIIALMISVGFAISDEYHQTFVSRKGGAKIGCVYRFRRCTDRNVALFFILYGLQKRIQKSNK